MKKKVLLLVPPGRKYYMRDYFCSKISKASYYYHPIDFVILSGILEQEFDLSVLDCIAEKLSVSDALLRVVDIRPDSVIFLSGAVSMKEDFIFLERVKSKTNALMVGIGDIFLDYGKELMSKHDFINALLLDFTTEDIKQFLNKKYATCNNIIYRTGNEIIEKQEMHLGGTFSIPLPKHELFQNDKYLFPFTKKKRFVTVLTNFGCPYKCTFCVVNRFNFKERAVSSVIEELKSINKININEVVFKDQTFAAKRSSAESLCQEIINEEIKISWSCFSRVDLMDEALLTKMKKAGCHTIIFGIETANSRLLSAFNKSLEINRIKEVLALCKELKITTVGTFIIGLPGDDRQSIEMTTAFAKGCCFDYASFNTFTPAYGTEIRYKLLKESAINDRVAFMDSGVSYPVSIKDCLSQKQIWSLRRAAILRFYFDPAYIFKKIKDCKTIFDAMNMLNQGLGVLRTLF